MKYGRLRHLMRAFQFADLRIRGGNRINADRSDDQNDSRKRRDNGVNIA